MRYIMVIIGMVVILGGLAGVKVSQIGTLISFGKAAASMGPPAEVVGSMKAKEDTWEHRLFSVGTIASGRGVTVSGEMGGVVQAIYFNSGQKVRKGQILLELDRRVELAELAAAKERKNLASINAERSRALFKGNAISKAQLDTDESTLRSTAANMASLQAQIDRKIVHAPFGGRLGIRLVNVGQFLTPGTPITELESTETNFVDFTLPQQQIERLKVGMLVHVNEAQAGPHGQAVISAIEPLVDRVARSGRVRATMREMDGLFSPGMFVNVSVVMPEKRKVTVVGATSLVRASFGDSIFIIEERKNQQPDGQGTMMSGPGGKPALVARQQFVKTGEVRGDFVEILEGVSIDNQVVSQGAFKLRNGVPVVVNNSIKLEPELSPHPQNL
jgi:membrane fusion protein (multidrug efflux system)